MQIPAIKTNSSLVLIEHFQVSFLRIMSWPIYLESFDISGCYSLEKSWGISTGGVWPCGTSQGCQYCWSWYFSDFSELELLLMRSHFIPYVFQRLHETTGWGHPEVWKRLSPTDSWYSVKSWTSGGACRKGFSCVCCSWMGLYSLQKSRCSL